MFVPIRHRLSITVIGVIEEHRIEKETKRISSLYLVIRAE